jgi:hypothetical protein
MPSPELPLGLVTVTQQPHGFITDEHQSWGTHETIIHGLTEQLAIITGVLIPAFGQGPREREPL